MNESETIVYNYLLNNGYNENEIVFNHSKSPDFVTSDKKWWEAKRLQNNGTICFTYNQLQEYPSKNVIVVITYKNLVFMVVSYSDIQSYINTDTPYAYLNKNVFCMLDERKMLYNKLMAEWNKYRVEHAAELEADCERWLKEREQMSELARSKPIL